MNVTFDRINDRFVDKNFQGLKERLGLVRRVVRSFEDANAAAITYLLPDGNNADADYYVVKTDASANAVTVTAYGTQLIEGAATLVLAAQFDKTLLTFDRGTQNWYRVSP